MAATVSLSDETLEIVPGETGRCEIAIKNTGSLVDQFSISLVGAPKDWVTIEPPVVNLMPAASATAAVVFAPPRSSEVVAGTHAFGVRVGSREEPAASVVEEGSVEVAPFQEIVAELVPGKRRARRRTKFRLAVDNLGNSPTAVQISLEIRTTSWRWRPRPRRSSPQPGTATIVKIRAAPHRRFLRGQPKMLPFQVVTRTSGEEPVKVAGVVQQEQLIPKWLLPALAACAVLVVAAIGFWYALLKPAVESVATEQTQEQVAKAETAASKATAAAQQAGAAATVARQAAGLETPSPGPKPSAASSAKPTAKPSPAPAKPSGTPAPKGPLSFRIATNAKVVTDGSFTDFKYVAPDEAEQGGYRRSGVAEPARRHRDPADLDRRGRRSGDRAGELPGPRLPLPRTAARQPGPAGRRLRQLHGAWDRHGPLHSLGVFLGQAVMKRCISSENVVSVTQIRPSRKA